VKTYTEILEQNIELIQQNAAIRASMADASTLLDRTYGSSGERLELRIARLIKIEQKQWAAIQKALAFHNRYCDRVGAADGWATKVHQALRDAAERVK
jgi:hypothetical protein